MNSNAMPIIRLELDYMKQSIISHLGAYGSELGKAIEENIQKAIDKFDFESVIISAANEVITQVIHDYFKYGKGRTVIQESIQEALDKILAKAEGGE